jgi:ankyrin repeat protein
MGLLCNGANVNIADVDGNTPMHFAVKNNLIPIIHALIAFEADIDYVYVHFRLRN